MPKDKKMNTNPMLNMIQSTSLNCLYSVLIEISVPREKEQLEKYKGATESHRTTPTLVKKQADTCTHYNINHGVRWNKSQYTEFAQSNIDDRQLSGCQYQQHEQKHIWKEGKENNTNTQ